MILDGWYMLMFQHAWYLVPLSLLAVVRLAAGGNIARIPAALALVIALYLAYHIIWPQISPPGQPRYIMGTEIHAPSRRMFALALATGGMLISAVMPDARWRWVDAAVVLMAVVTAWSVWSASPPS